MHNGLYKSSYIGKYNVYNIINGTIVVLDKVIIYFCIVIKEYF